MNVLWTIEVVEGELTEVRQKLSEILGKLVGKSIE